MPVEILEHILTDLISSSIYNPRYDSVFPDALSVCKKWRDIAIHSPRCWSSIEIDLLIPDTDSDTTFPLIIARIHKRLSLAQGHPIDLTLLSSVCHGTFAWIADKIFDSFLTDFPNLRTYQEHKHGFLLDLLSNLESHHYQNLTHLRVSGWHTLDGMRDVEDILYEDKEIHLPHLESLYLNHLSPTFLQYISCPNLESLYVNYQACPYDPDWDPDFSYLDLVRCLQRVPKVSTLAVEADVYEGPFSLEEHPYKHEGIKTFALTASQWETDVFWRPRDLVAIFPNLSKLILESCVDIIEWGEDCPEITELTFFMYYGESSRPDEPGYEGRQLFSTLSRLRYLRIGYEIAVSDHHPGFKWPDGGPETYALLGDIGTFISCLSPNLNQHEPVPLCRELRNIHLNSMELDWHFLRIIEQCLEARQEKSASISSTETVVPCTLTTRGCTYGKKETFPDLTNVMYQEFQHAIHPLLINALTQKDSVSDLAFEAGDSESE